MILNRSRSRRFGRLRRRSAPLEPPPEPQEQRRRRHLAASLVPRRLAAPVVVRREVSCFTSGLNRGLFCALRNRVRVSRFCFAFRVRRFTEILSPRRRVSRNSRDNRVTRWRFARVQYIGRPRYPSVAVLSFSISCRPSRPAIVHARFVPVLHDLRSRFSSLFVAQASDSRRKEGTEGRKGKEKRAEREEDEEEGERERHRRRERTRRCDVTHVGSR